jgi:hypothetical protein
MATAIENKGRKMDVSSGLFGENAFFSGVFRDVIAARFWGSPVFCLWRPLATHLLRICYGLGLRRSK